MVILRTPSLAVALVALTFAPNAAAQLRVEPPSIGRQMVDVHARLPELLRSASAVDQAWGAWIAGRDQIQDAIPLLEWLVARQLADPGGDAGYALTYSLDALIQLDANPSIELLDRIAERRPVEALVLAWVWDAAADPVFLSMLDRAGGRGWFAAANRLLARRPPGFAAKLLNDLRLAGRLTIADPGAGYGHGEGSGSKACGVLGQRRPDLPPPVRYDLTSSAGRTSVLLADGPVPVYYERRTDITGFSSTMADDTVTPASRLRYLSALAGATREPLEASSERTVAWRPGLDVDAAVRAFRSDIDRRFRLLVGDLTTAGFLTAEEAEAASADIDIEVVDLHGGR